MTHAANACRGLLAISLVLAGCAAPDTDRNRGRIPMTLEQIKQGLLGEWTSVAPEVRPSATRNPDDSLKAFYLTREFRYLGDDRFELSIVNTADPYARTPVARIHLRGHMLGGETISGPDAAAASGACRFIKDANVASVKGVLGIDLPFTVTCQGTW